MRELLIGSKIFGTGSEAKMAITASTRSFQELQNFLQIPRSSATFRHGHIDHKP